MSEPRLWHTRGYLPHYDDGRSLQMITYRLGDALPKNAIDQLKEQTIDDESRRAAIDHFLDAGHGSCSLRDPAKARAVLETWQHSDGSDYHLHAWVIMPNHVHVLIEPLPPWTVGAIVRAWKRVSAKRIKRIDSTNALGAVANSPFWQQDYYDRFIRNESHYRAALDYIHQNPVKARFVIRPEDWPWTSALRKESKAFPGPRPPPAASARQSEKENR